MCTIIQVRFLTLIIPTKLFVPSTSHWRLTKVCVAHEAVVGSRVNHRVTRQVSIEL